MNTNEKLQKLVDLVTKDQLRHHVEVGLTYEGHKKDATARMCPGKKYVKIDVGTSGKLMIDIATEEIFGIKAYGVIHRGHKYGTLDTIDEWDWSDYYPRKK